MVCRPEPRAKVSSALEPRVEGLGIRTLSAHIRYNLCVQRGSVWPHDNASSRSFKRRV